MGAKPACAVLAPRGRLAVLEFGVARCAGASGADRAVVDTLIARTRIAGSRARAIAGTGVAGTGVLTIIHDGTLVFGLAGLIPGFVGLAAVLVVVALRDGSSLADLGTGRSPRLLAWLVRAVVLGVIGGTLGHTRRRLQERQVPTPQQDVDRAAVARELDLEGLGIAADARLGRDDDAVVVPAGVERTSRGVVDEADGVRHQVVLDLGPELVPLIGEALVLHHGLG